MIQHLRVCKHKNIGLVILATLPILSLEAVQVLADSPAAVLTFSKQYSAERSAPVVNDYVKYDVTILDKSNMPIENQILWVSFMSKDGITSVHTTFQIPRIAPNEEAVLHLGPFKMREAGEHLLFLGINSIGNSSLPNEVSLNYDSTEPIDRVQVSLPGESRGLGALALLAGSAAIIAIVTIIVIYRHKRRQ